METIPTNASYFTNLGYNVKVRDYGTPMYAQMFTILEGDNPLFEVRRNPYSKKSEGGIFEDRCCHIRLCNRFCYSVSPVDTLREFLIAHQYQLIGISRLDICLDFIRFDKKTDPHGFLRAFFAGKYRKINQCNISAHGVDRWDGQIWNSVKWGSPSSMVSTKLYDKTLEMRQCHPKSYIVDQWQQAGLAEYQIVEYYESDKNSGELLRRYKNVVVPFIPGEKKLQLGIDRNKAVPIDTVTPVSVWRVEFSISTEGRHWVDLGSGRTYDLSLLTIDNRQKLLFLFHSLASHYFRFKEMVKKSDGSPQRKDRCPDKVLFVTTTDERAYKPIRLTLKRDVTRIDRILIHRLMDIVNSPDTTTQEEWYAASVIVRQLQERVLDKYVQLYADDISKRIEEYKQTSTPPIH